MQKVILTMFLAFTWVIGLPQSVLFLHHSTGEGVYIEGNVAGWVSNYNLSNGTNYIITERSYPNTPYPWENYPYDYWNLWINNQCNTTNPDIQCLNIILQNYDVVVFKHCFPGAAIIADNGNPSVSSSVKTLANYKLQYRALRGLMDQYPQKKFIIWTLAPLHRLETNTADAARASEFVTWVKSSWLTEDGKSHPNIYVFDFFGLVAELNPAPVNGNVNCLKFDYERSHTVIDSHPNTLANQTVGPLFGQFIVNTIKNVSTGVATDESLPSILLLYPNPVRDVLILDFSQVDDQVTSVNIYNLNGRQIFNKILKGESDTQLDIKGLPAGTYLVKINTKLESITRKFSVLDN